MKLSFEKVKEFLRAIVSLRHGHTHLNQYWQREQACLWSNAGQPCPALKIVEQNIYCSECGCPFWPHADMRVKWNMPGATCPRNKWEQ